MPAHDKPPAGKPPARKRLTIDISEAHHLNPRLLAASGIGRRAAAAAAAKSAQGRGGPAPAYAPLPSMAPLRRAHSGSELMGLVGDAAAAGPATCARRRAAAGRGQDYYHRQQPAATRSAPSIRTPAAQR